MKGFVTIKGQLERLGRFEISGRMGQSSTVFKTLGKKTRQKFV